MLFERYEIPPDPFGPEDTVPPVWAAPLMLPPMNAAAVNVPLLLMVPEMLPDAVTFMHVTLPTLDKSVIVFPSLTVEVPMVMGVLKFASNSPNGMGEV